MTESKKMQVTFAPDIRALEKLGANWYNIVMDISTYLEGQGFLYERTLGFINDRELSEKEIAELMEEIVDIALGKKYLLYLNVSVISDVQDLTSFFTGRDEE